MAGQVTMKQIYEVAKAKQADAHVAHLPLDSVCRSIMGSAHSMGLKIVPGREGDPPSDFAPDPAAKFWKK